MYTYVIANVCNIHVYEKETIKKHSSLVVTHLYNRQFVYLWLVFFASCLLFACIHADYQYSSIKESIYQSASVDSVQW